MPFPSLPPPFLHHLQAISLPDWVLGELQELCPRRDVGALHQFPHRLAQDEDAVVGMPLVGANLHQRRVHVVDLPVDLPNLAASVCDVPAHLIQALRHLALGSDGGVLLTSQLIQLSLETGLDVIKARIQTLQTCAEPR